MRGAGFLPLTSEWAACRGFSKKTPTLLSAFWENAISIFMPTGVASTLTGCDKGL